VNRDLRMWNLLSLLGYKIPLITSIIFRGDYLVFANQAWRTALNH